MRRTKQNFLNSAAICLASAVVGLTAAPAFADTIKLMGVQGDINLEGEFIKFENDIFTIRTSLGDLNIAADAVTCEGAACPQNAAQAGEITIVGSETLGTGLMPFLIEGFATEDGATIDSQRNVNGYLTTEVIGDGGFGEPVGTFRVLSNSSSDAFTALQSPDVKIGMSSRRILPAEARQLRNFGAGNLIELNQEHVVAVDSLSVIVHPDNPLGTISLENLDLIFSGRITNWAEIGGPNAPIVLYSREDGSGSQAVFEERVFAQSGRVQTDAVEVVASHEAMASAVRANPFAIGYIGSAFERGTKALDLVGSCGLSFSPNAFSAKTEEYPLQRRLYLYNRADNVDATTQEFIDYVTSDAADSVIAKSGLINLSISRVQQDRENGRIRSVLQNAVDPFEFQLARDMLLDMFEWNRLSTTFRFASGSARLDGKGLEDLGRLIDFLKVQPAGTEVSVVGFTDGDGAFGSNQGLSVVRAQQVADELLNAGGADLQNVSVGVKGYGELSPAACNDSLEGKRINRRVEVWVRQGA